MFKTLFDAVDGHKTDILMSLAILGAIVSWLGVVFGWWTYEQLQRLPEIAASIIVPLAGMTFRDALRKE